MYVYIYVCMHISLLCKVTQSDLIMEIRFKRQNEGKTVLHCNNYYYRRFRHPLISTIYSHFFFFHQWISMQRYSKIIFKSLAIARA